jgi:hypothetical protein
MPDDNTIDLRIQATDEASGPIARAADAIDNISTTVERVSKATGLAGGDMLAFERALDACLRTGQSLPSALDAIAHSTDYLVPAVTKAAAQVALLPEVMGQTTSATGSLASSSGDLGSVFDALSDRINQTNAALVADQGELRSMGSIFDGLAADLTRTEAVSKATGQGIHEVNEEAGDGAKRFAEFAESVREFIENPLHASGVAVKNFLLELGSVGAVVLGVGATLAVIGKEALELAAEFGAAAKQTQLMGERIGWSWSQLKAFSDEAKIAGTEIGSLVMGARRLAVAIDDPTGAGKALAKQLSEMGISATDTGSALEQVIDHLSNLTSQTERASEAYKIFGRQSMTLLPLIQRHKELREEVEKLGPEIDAAGASQLIALDDSLKKLSIAWERLKGSFAAWLAEPARKVIDLAIRFVVAGGGFSDISNVLKGAGQALELAWNELTGKKADFAKGAYDIQWRTEQTVMQAGVQVMEAAVEANKKAAASWKAAFATTKEGMQDRIREIKEERAKLLAILENPNTDVAVRTMTDTKFKALGAEMERLQAALKVKPEDQSAIQQQEIDGQLRHGLAMIELQRHAAEEQVRGSKDAKQRLLDIELDYNRQELALNLKAIEAKRALESKTPGRSDVRLDNEATAAQDRFAAANQKAIAAAQRENENDFEKITSEYIKNVEKQATAERKKEDEREKIVDKQIADVGKAMRLEEAGQMEHQVRMLNLQKDTAEFQQKHGLITAKQRVDTERDVDEQIADLQKKSIQKQIDLLDQKDVTYATKRQELLNKLQAMEDAAAARQQKQQERVAAEILKPFETAFHKINSSFESAISGWVRGTQTFGQAFSGMLANLVADTISSLALAGVKWAEHELLKIGLAQAAHGILVALHLAEAAEEEATGAATRTSEVVGLAAVGAAAAYASTAAIPIVGPELAPAVAAATGSAIMGFAPAAAAEGGWDLPGGGPFPAVLHEKEMVLPKDLAEKVRAISDPARLVRQAQQAPGSAPAKESSLLAQRVETMTATLAGSLRTVPPPPQPTVAPTISLVGKDTALEGHVADMASGLQAGVRTLTDRLAAQLKVLDDNLSGSVTTIAETTQRVAPKPQAAPVAPPERKETLLSERMKAMGDTLTGIRTATTDRQRDIVPTPAPKPTATPGAPVAPPGKKESLIGSLTDMVGGRLQNLQNLILQRSTPTQVPAEPRQGTTKPAPVLVHSAPPAAPAALRTPQPVSVTVPVRREESALTAKVQAVADAVNTQGQRRDVPMAVAPVSAGRSDGALASGLRNFNDRITGLTGGTARREPVAAPANPEQTLTSRFRALGEGFAANFRNVTLAASVAAAAVGPNPSTGPAPKYAPPAPAPVTITTAAKEAVPPRVAPIPSREPAPVKVTAPVTVAEPAPKPERPTTTTTTGKTAPKPVEIPGFARSLPVVASPLPVPSPVQPKAEIPTGRKPVAPVATQVPSAVPPVKVPDIKKESVKPVPVPLIAPGPAAVVPPRSERPAPPSPQETRRETVERSRVDTSRVIESIRTLAVPRPAPLAPAAIQVTMPRESRGIPTAIVGKPLAATAAPILSPAKPSPLPGPASRYVDTGISDGLVRLRDAISSRPRPATATNEKTSLSPAVAPVIRPVAPVVLSAPSARNQLIPATGQAVVVPQGRPVVSPVSVSVPAKPPIVSLPAPAASPARPVQVQVQIPTSPTRPPAATTLVPAPAPAPRGVPAAPPAPATARPAVPAVPSVETRPRPLAASVTVPPDRGPSMAERVSTLASTLAGNFRSMLSGPPARSVPQPPAAVPARPVVQAPAPALAARVPVQTGVRAPAPVIRPVDRTTERTATIRESRVIAAPAAALAVSRGTDTSLADTIRGLSAAMTARLRTTPTVVPAPAVTPTGSPIAPRLTGAQALTIPAGGYAPTTLGRRSVTSEPAVSAAVSRQMSVPTLPAQGGDRHVHYHAAPGESPQSIRNNKAALKQVLQELARNGDLRFT